MVSSVLLLAILSVTALTVDEATVPEEVTGTVTVELSCSVVSSVVDVDVVPLPQFISAAEGLDFHLVQYPR